jgi:hypothetical protein
MGRVVARGFGLGFLIGVAWGALARVFMRLVSTEPSFSWVGTGMILALAGLFWGLVGIVVAARADGRSRWWRLAALPGMVLFASQGLLLLPGAIVVAVGLAARSVGLRFALVALGSGGTYWLATVLDDERFLAPRYQSLGYLVAAICVAWLGVGFHAWWRRWPTRPTTAIREPSTAAVR